MKPDSKTGRRILLALAVLVASSVDHTDAADDVASPVGPGATMSDHGTLGIPVNDSVGSSHDGEVSGAVTPEPGDTIVLDPDQPTNDLDFGSLLFGPPPGSNQQVTLAVDSVGGNDGGAGTLYAPRQSLPSAPLANGSVLGLYRGSSFRASLPLPQTTTHGIVVQDVALGSVKALPIVSAMDATTDEALFQDNGDGSYSYLWTPTDTLTNDGYSNVYVVEINALTAATTPIASRRRMTDVSSQSAVATTPGSVYILPPGTGSGQSGSATQWKAILHPSDSLSPRDSRYIYDFTSRVQPADWGTFASNAGDGTMSGLELVGGNSGYGALSGPRGFAGDRLVFVHASTHNAVIFGGSLTRSVFYESGDLANGYGPSIQLAWYADTGTGLRWSTSRCLFYMNVGDRFANGLISHTSGSSTFDQGNLSQCAFLGARWSNGSLQGTAIDYVNVAAGTISQVYVQGVLNAFGGNMPLATELKNSVFREVRSFVTAGNYHDNLVQTVNSADPNAASRNPSICSFQQSGASATHNLFWAHTDTLSGLSGDDQVGGVQAQAGCTFAHNIVVLDPANTTSVPTYMTQLANQSAFSCDYNLVINLSKAGFGAQGPNGGYFSWAAYQGAYPTQDQHSLYVDLSSDPRGLSAVFADPANGDFRWAQTDVARRCAAYCNANGVGPAAVTSRWPSVPSVDEAVRLLTDL